MAVSVCVEGPAPGGGSSAERQCLPDAAVYVLGVFVLVAIVCTVVAAARFIKDWLKLHLLARKAPRSEVMTLDQFAELRRKTNWMARTR